MEGRNEVSRNGLVKYVANKLGGVHWDNSRGAWSDPIGSRHRFLDENHFFVGRIPASMFEIISIAFDLAHSGDVSVLIDKINQIYPEPVSNSSTLKLREGRTGEYADFVFNKAPDP